MEDCGQRATWLDDGADWTTMQALHSAVYRTLTGITQRTNGPTQDKGVGHDTF